MLLMRFSSLSVPLTQRLVTFRRNVTGFSSSSNKHPRNFYSCKKSIGQNGITCSTFDNLPSTSASKDSPLSGVEDVLMCYIYGKKKATEVAHLVWKHVVQKGDTVVDATCGNGYDTLAMLKMVADESGMGRVYGMDIQKDAVEITSSLLGESLNPYEKELVKLFAICHSRMEEVVPKDTSVRLVAFNLGYLPGGDKAITTKSGTTLLALEAAKRILVPGGLISIVVYVGHPGGREEFETVQAFASGLSVENWICCKFQMLNRPLAPLALQFVIVDFIDRNHINLDAEGNEENMLNTELAMGSNSVSMFCTRWLVQVSSAHLDI